jgi:hypothetical protein
MGGYVATLYDLVWNSGRTQTDSIGSSSWLSSATAHYIVQQNPTARSATNKAECNKLSPPARASVAHEAQGATGSSSVPLDSSTALTFPQTLKFSVK